MIAVDDRLDTDDADARQLKLYQAGRLGWATFAGNPAAGLVMLSALYKVQGSLARLLSERNVQEQLESLYRDVWPPFEKRIGRATHLPETRLVLVGPHLDGGNWWLSAYMDGREIEPRVSVCGGRVVDKLGRFAEAICVGNDAYRDKARRALRDSVHETESARDWMIAEIRRRADGRAVNPSGHMALWDGTSWALLRFREADEPRRFADILG